MGWGSHRLPELAGAELTRLEDRTLGQPLPGLTQWIPQLSPELVAPTHLAPLLECLEAIQRGETVRVVCHTPPRGGKTVSLLHAISWWLHAHPSWRVAYCSYNASQARSMARHGMELARQSGIFRGGGVTEWRTARGGGCIARGVGEGITGQGADIAIVDDPHKDRVDVESALRRDRVWDWFRECLYTRGNPSVSRARPRSIIVNMARWHPDDLAGRLIKLGWRYICLPAINDNEESFWPQGWSLEQLREIRETLGPYSWTSLYQGAPRPRGGSVFDTPHVWTELPRVFRVARGLDLSYTASTSSDFSVLATALEYRGLYYLVDLIRKQERAPAFQARIKRHIAHRWPQTPIWMYASGTETGVIDLMAAGKDGLRQLVSQPATKDKFLRAQFYAAAWNAGRVLVPEDSDAFPWVDEFVSEHLNFTGLEDVHDDQVDAGAAMFDSLRRNVDEKSVSGPAAKANRPGLAGMPM